MSDHGHGHSAPKSSPKSSGGGLNFSATPLAVGLVGCFALLINYALTGRSGGH